MNREFRVNGDLFERTKQLAVRVVRLYVALPKSSEAQVLGKQVLRSGTSVGLTITKLGGRDRSRSLLVS